MLINYKEIQNLAWFDSEYFDKEGFLLVQEQTNNEQINYVERFVRLKGNLLFILKIPNLCVELSNLDNQNEISSTTDEVSKKRIESLISFYKTNQIDTNLLFVIVLNSEFSLRRFDENTRNCGFIIEFYNAVDLKSCWNFTCLTVEERDNWIDQINRTNYVQLKSIFNLLLERKLKLIKERKKSYLNAKKEESNEHLSNQFIHKSISKSSELNQSNSSTNLTQSISSNNLNSNLANLNQSIDSLSVISTKSLSNESLDFKVSTTISLINQNNLQHQIKDGLKSIFLTDSYFKRRNSFEKLTTSYSFTLSIKLNQIYRIDYFQPEIFIKVYCSLTNGQTWSVLGRTETLQIYFSESTKFAKKFYLNLFEKIELQNNLSKIVKFDLENKKILLKFNIYNLIEPFTERFVLIGTAIDYFKKNSNIEIFSSVHYKPLQIGQLKMTALDNSEFNIFNHHLKDEYSTNNSIDTKTIDKKQINGFLFEPQLFVNTIHRSFQFELNNPKDAHQVTIININELMAEPILLYTLVQDLM